MENHFECLWDLFRRHFLAWRRVRFWSEYYWLNKHDDCAVQPSPMRSGCSYRWQVRTEPERLHGDHEAVLYKDEDLYNKKIEDFFDDEVFNSNFWLYWRTMFAFENWHSALEMKLYIQRFIHHIGGLPDFSALKFTKYNQYESLILPMVKYLEAAVYASGTIRK